MTARKKILRRRMTSAYDIQLALLEGKIYQCSVKVADKYVIVQLTKEAPSFIRDELDITINDFDAWGTKFDYNAPSLVNKRVYETAEHDILKHFIEEILISPRNIHPRIVIHIMRRSQPDDELFDCIATGISACCLKAKVPVHDLICPLSVNENTVVMIGVHSQMLWKVKSLKLEDLLTIPTLKCVLKDWRKLYATIDAVELSTS